MQPLFERRKNLSKITEAFRLIARGEINLDVACDLYGNYACVWFFDEKPIEELISEFAPTLKQLQQYYPIQGGVYKQSGINPHEHRLVQAQHVFGNPPPDYFWVREYNLEYQVSLTHAQNPGLFLDQRENRKLIGLLSQGKRVANLFAYTGSFSVQASKANAEVVVSVDLSKKYLEWAKVNFERNGLKDTNGKFVAEDVLKWVARQNRKTEREGEAALWDLIVCDPPTFSTADQGSFSVLKNGKQLIQDLSVILKADGILFFSTNQVGLPSSQIRSWLDEIFPKVYELSPALDYAAGKNEGIKYFISSQNDAFVLP